MRVFCGKLFLKEECLNNGDFKLNFDAESSNRSNLSIIKYQDQVLISSRATFC